MKAIVNTSLLGKELKIISQIIGSNHIIPILSCIKLSFEKTKLTLFATDLETTLISTIQCDAKSPFTLIVDFNSLSDICNKLSEPITIEGKEKEILITGEGSKFKLPMGGGESEFPNIPDESFQFTVDVDVDFFSTLYRADSCKGKNDLMVTYNTACLDFKKDKLVVVGTDAFCMYKKDLKIKSGQISQSLVRDKFVNVVKSFDNGKLSIGEKFVKIEHKNITIITRVQDNKFCAYDTIIPTEVKYNVMADRTALISAISKALVGSTKSTNMCALNFKEGRISIVSQDVDFGKEGQADVLVNHTVDIDAIGVNGKQLLGLLNLLDSEEVEMCVTAPNKSIYLKQSDDDSVFCLLQPLMLS
jgi:DNA polymerase-3 subunit beta